MYKFGCDLTSFGSINSTDNEKINVFKGFLKALGINPETEPSEDNGFTWKGDDVTLVTSNNPITGNHHYDSKSNEIGYASYMGLEGNKEKIEAGIKYLEHCESEDKANVKEYDPGNRYFI